MPESDWPAKVTDRASWWPNLLSPADKRDGHASERGDPPRTRYAAALPGSPTNAAGAAPCQYQIWRQIEPRASPAQSGSPRDGTDRKPRRRSGWSDVAS